MEVIEVGTRVRAKLAITEDGGDPDLDAKPFNPGFIHAKPGEEGVVDSFGKAGDEIVLNVHFDRSDMLCTVGQMEVEVVE